MARTSIKTIHNGVRVRTDDEDRLFYQVGHTVYEWKCRIGDDGEFPRTPTLDDGQTMCYGLEHRGTVIRVHDGESLIDVIREEWRRARRIAASIERARW